MRYSRLFIIIASLISSNSYAITINDPCGGPSAMLALINRPSFADSACTVPAGERILETGYQYAWLHGGGIAQTWPITQLRFGLPGNNEFAALLPSDVRQNIVPRRGSTATTLSFKHEIGYTEKWLGAAEIVMNMPNGSREFGSKHIGTTVNGIVTYSMPYSLSLTGFFGANSYSEAAADGGERYSSLTLDMLLAWLANQNTSVYGEAFGQTHTAANEGSGYNFDIGVMYLIRRNITVDVSVGRRISGSLIGFNQYVGAGLSILF
jgi:hypothetical protein